MDRSTMPPLPPIAEGHACHGCAARALAICSALGPDELAALRCRGGRVAVAAGETLFHEGDPATQVFNLTGGALRLTRLLPDGRRQVLGFRFPGDFVGIGEHASQPFTAEALQDSSLCRFSRARFEEFAADYPELGRALFRKATRELAAAQAQLLLLGRKSAPERLASFLLELADRQAGADQAQRPFVDLPMSRSDIADHLGLTKETISRLLAQFRAGRLLRLEALNRVELLDRTALRALAEGQIQALAA
ncbi:helix-turn-helix domain-containing protein [Sphingomonas sp. KRR8]|uniref:Crp/Fnr family transcriptional regulator n=1 Tax=Sphingomonas sp. KRR8 TaxID=2942996 RepID=UPI002020FB91|nr:helix-turn-helix domain-containing protein [Sphingomonas sp. KRR8]URD60785.1 helix-turn-helix domain-containing protein [Sphingomonas sp. KRR8]